MQRYKITWLIVKVLAVLIMTIFLIYPVAKIIGASFLDEYTQVFTFNNYASYFTVPYYRTALLNSLSLGALGTILIMIIALPLVYFLTHYRAPGYIAFNSLIWLPYLMPAFIGAYSWILLFGKFGFATKFLRSTMHINIPTIHGYWGMLVVFVLSYFPFAYMLLKGAFESVDPDLEEAAATMGSNRIRTFLTVILPATMPSILNATLLIFILIIDSFGIPAIIGFDTPVLTTTVYGEFTSEMGGVPSMASAGAMLLLFISISILILQRFYLQRTTYASSVVRRLIPAELKSHQKILGTTVLSIFFLIALLPTIAILFSSITKAIGPVLQYGHFSLDNYKNIFYGIPGAFGNSYTFATLAAFFDVAAGVFIAYVLARNIGKLNTALDAFVAIPLGVPGIVVALGFILAFNRKPILLVGTAWILIIAYAIRRLPYAVRSISSLLYQIDPSVEEAALTLGAKLPRTIFGVVARLALPGVISAGLLTWTFSVADLTTTIMLYTAYTRTLTVFGYSQMIGNAFGTASAIAIVLLASVLLPVVILNFMLSWMRKRQES